MSFAVAAEAYDRFMGRYSIPLASVFADFAGVAEGQRVLDVGAGPGALTDVLVSRVGVPSVAAVDPSEPFVEALSKRQPGVDIRLSRAETLPFAADGFDTVLAQLVVHFMSDPVAGLREMARVTRPAGVVAACVWDHGGDRGPLSIYWKVVRELDPSVDDESQLAGATEGDLTRLFGEAGLSPVDEVGLEVVVHHETFEEWWEPYTLGVGPAGAYVAGLDEEHRERLRERCAELVHAPFSLTARAWSARARV